MKKLWWLLLAMSALFANASVQAVRVTSLYSASLPVNSQAESERNATLKQGLAQVLIKVSGNPQVVDNKAIKSHLKEAVSLIQEYGYQTTNNAAKPFLLQMNFDPEGVNKLLRDAGVATWGQVRPLILIWLDYEIPHHAPEMINSDSTSLIPATLKQRADMRGLPIIFPVMDVTDLSLVSANDISNMAIPKLLNASKRYESDAILIGKIIPTTKGYSSHWQLIMGENQWGWDVTGQNVEAVVAAEMDNVTNALATRYSAVMTNDVKTTVTLKVVGIEQGDDITQLMTYLKHLPPVMDVQVAQVTGTDVVLTISLRGDEKVLTQAITLGQKLLPQPNPADSSMLIYQWKH